MQRNTIHTSPWSQYNMFAVNIGPVSINLLVNNFLREKNIQKEE